MLLTILLALAPQQLELRLSMGDWDVVLSRLRAELGEAVAVKNAAAEGWARVQIAHALVERNFYHEKDEASADDASREAMSVAEERAPAALGWALSIRGRFLYSRAFDNKDWAAPERHFLRALAFFEKERDRRAQSESWFYLGLIEQMQERHEKAASHFRKGLQLARPFNDPLLESYFHRHLGYAAQEQGRIAEAEMGYLESLRLREKAGAKVFIPFAQIALADFLARSERESGRVRDLYEAAAATADDCGSRRAAFQAHLALARLLADEEPKRGHAMKALEAARAYGDPANVREAEALLQTLPDSESGGKK
jgi:tetratricopeptide (TPR) repeat protein